MTMVIPRSHPEGAERGRLAGRGELRTLSVYDSEPWMTAGICRQVGQPDLWHQPPKSQDTVEAKKVCQGCPVRIECLDYAIRRRIPYGTWGGLDEKEIRSLLLAAYQKARARPLIHAASARKKVTPA